ncbi:hypothetical protein SAMN04489722_103154 [Algibacter lectus]|uniref:hypothetical protein n=1 Tax=Algibacter lectus TaxID=221126 RepID=UPI0008EA70D4|nr:hypothetical protein [Algibacter lectus]SFC68091.1 hypothetical protein SAMN04489722_103154 [Algibacter lectus]
MKKINTYLKLGILTLLTSLMFNNCEKEENEQIDVNTISTQLLADFNQTDYSELIPYDYTVDWSSPTEQYSEELELSYYELPISYTSSFNPNELNKFKKEGTYYIKYKVIAIENNDESFNFYAIKFYQNVYPLNNDLINADVSFSNLNSFTGIIHLVNNNKKLVYKKQLNEGRLIMSTKFNNKKGSNTNSSSLYGKSSASCPTITVATYTDWYSNSGPGGSFVYTHTQHTGYTTINTCNGSSGLPEINKYGSNGEGIYVKKKGNGGVYNDDSSEEDENIVLIEDEISNCASGLYPNANGDCVTLAELYDKIDSSELTGKAKCLHDLLDKNGSSYIKDLMSKFKGESEFDIKIVSKDKVISSKTGEEINGSTSPIINGVITISINSSKVNLHSDLATTKTILHEYIHADIRRKLKTQSPSSTDKEFKDDFEQYGKDHHETMGALYVNSMRDALKFFHKNVLKSDYEKYTNYYEEKPSDDFYEALAWRGLKEHDVKAWNELSPSRKQEIENLSLRIDNLTSSAKCN